MCYFSDLPSTLSFSKDKIEKCGNKIKYNNPAGYGKFYAYTGETRAFTSHLC